MVSTQVPYNVALDYSMPSHSYVYYHKIGKYVGNRPMKLRKSTWKDRMFLEVKKKEKAKKKLGFKV